MSLRYTFRTLRRSPAFTIVAVLTLGLAIGANTAIFSVVNGVMLRALPYRDSGRLAMLWTSVRRDHEDESATSVPNYLDWKSQSRTFEDMAFYSSEGATLLDDRGRLDPEIIDLADVSPNFFEVLGVPPRPGRTFAAQEAGRAVVLSHQLWQSRFGAAPDLIGQTVNLDGAGFQVIGVMPADFEFPTKKTQLWRPASVSPWWTGFAGVRRRNAVAVFGRLRRDSTVQQAQAEMTALTHRLELAYPESNQGRSARVVPLQAQVLGKTVPFLLLVLSGAVAFVLLIACTNVANLPMARAAARRREFALRVALGASRMQLLRQMLAESLTLSLAGACLGLALGAWGVHALAVWGPPNIPRLGEIQIDWRVLAFTLAVAILGGVLLGLAPAFKMGRRSLLVIAEFSLAMVLLTGAGLLIRSFTAALAVDPGLRPEHVVTMELNLRYDDFYQQVMDRLRALPGVEAVGAINDIFFGRGGKSMGDDTLDEVEGHAPEPRDQWKPLAITPNSGDAFQALGIRLLKGRFFSERDDEKAPLVVTGSALGWWFAEWATGALASWRRLDLSLAPDHTVLFFTLTLSLLAGLAFGLAPLWRVSAARCCGWSCGEAWR